MNKRIKKKVAIRRCEKALERFKKNVCAELEPDEYLPGFIKGAENMYSRRIATIKKGGLI